MSEEIVMRVKQSVSPTSQVNQQIVDPMLKGFFRLNDSEITAADRSKLEEIGDFFSGMDEMEKVEALKDMRFRLGAPSLGVSEINQFHRYIRIRSNIKMQEAELKALER